MTDQIPLNICQLGWTWKAHYEPVVVDGIEKSTRVVPADLVEALIEATQEKTIRHVAFMARLGTFEEFEAASKAQVSAIAAIREAQNESER